MLSVKDKPTQKRFAALHQFGTDTLFSNISQLNSCFTALYHGDGSCKLIHSFRKVTRVALLERNLWAVFTAI